MTGTIGWAGATALVAVGIMAGATCNETFSSSSPAAGNGTLRVLVTDKPFPFEFIESAVVTLTRVEVHQADAAESEDPAATAKTASQPAGQNEDNDDDEDSETGGGWITFFDDPVGKPFDLVDLRNGRTNLLDDAELPAGTYDQLRLIVTGGEVTLTDGRVFPLKVPSGETSGIKLHFTFEVVEGEETLLLLDVDLSRAFKPIPGGKIKTPDDIKQFHFQPSLAMRLINLLEAGSITGLVTDSAAAPLGGVAVTAFKEGVEVTSTSTEPDGTYKLVGLTTGTYSVAFSSNGFVDLEVSDISVTAGQETKDVNAVLIAAQ